MIVVTLVAVIFGSSLGWVRYERYLLQHKWEVCRTLHSKGIELASKYPAKTETWRGNESINYVRMCTLYPKQDALGLSDDDITNLITTFADVEDVAVVDREISGGQLRKLASFPKLKKMLLFNSPSKEDDLRWVKAYRPDVELIVETRP